MALTLTDVTGICKTQYLPGMQMTLKAPGTVTGLIESRGQKETNVSYQFTKSFQIGLSEGGGMRAYDGALPTAGKTKYATFTGTCKHYYHVIKLYKGIISLMKSDKQAFIQALSGEMDGAQEAIKFNMERMNFGDGGATPIAIGSAASNTSGQIVRITVNDTRFIRPGMSVDCLDTNHVGITNGVGLIVDSVDVDNNYVYLTAVATGEDLTTLVSALNTTIHIFAEGGHDAEFDGFGVLVRSLTATVLGINRSTAANAWARPHVWKKDSSGSGISIGAPTGTPHDWEIKNIRKPVRELLTRWQVDKAGLLGFATTDLLGYYAQLWAAEGGYHQQLSKVDGWPYDSYAIDGVPILDCLFAGKNGIDFVYMPDLVTFENQPLEWEDMDGNMWKWVSGYDAYTAYLSLRKQLGHYSPYKCAHVGDLKGEDDD